MTLATFVIVEPPVPGSTNVFSTNTAESDSARVPTSHRPSFGVYDPWVVAHESSESPGGTASVTTTPVALSGPTFRSVMVNERKASSAGVSSLAILRRRTSARSIGNPSVSP